MKSNAPVVILCGGRGIYIDDSGERRPKGLVRISGEPLFIHVIYSYLASGFNRFILSTGYQGQSFKSILTQNYAAKKGSDPHQYWVTLKGIKCEIQVEDTGLDSSTGTRIRKVAPLLKDQDWFCVTYSDVLSSVNLAEVAQTHMTRGKLATLVGVKLPTRFRILGLKAGDPLVRGFASKPVIQNDYINGGFYFFNKKILETDYLGSEGEIVLEEAILEKLALEGNLLSFPHGGSWHYLDCERDITILEKIAGEISPSDVP